MRIWLATVGEPVPGDATDVRLLRTGMLAHHLARSGHQVTWWNSDFDHHRKCHRTRGNGSFSLEPGLRLRLLHGCGYRSHVSLDRLWDHQQVASAFRRLAPMEPTPDVIVAGYPTIELAGACIEYGQASGVPVALDIRDLWPDIFARAVPETLRPLARIALMPYDAYARSVLRGADALFAVTEPMVAWGLGKACRARRPVDVSIPFSYPSAPDPDPAADAAWSRAGLNHGHSVICFFGTFGRQFDLATVILAGQLLQERGLNQVRLVLCGDGDQLSACRRMAVGISTILMPGWIQGDAITALMSRSIVGLAPYHPESDFMMSIPNKPVEYMSAGLPVLTCLEGLLSDLVQSAGIGWTYRHGDPVSLADAIAGIVAAPATARLRGQAAHALFRAEFDRDRVMRRYEQAILGLVR